MSVIDQDPSMDEELLSKIWESIVGKRPWGNAVRICRGIPSSLSALKWLAAWEQPEVNASEQATRALRFARGEEHDRFVGFRQKMRSRLCEGAARRAAARLCQWQGPDARLNDGRPAGYLLLVAGLADEAEIMLAGAAGAAPTDGKVLSCLAEALWRAGKHDAGIRAFSHAALVDFSGIDDDDVETVPIQKLLVEADDLALPGDARAWIPTLADLSGIAPLPVEALSERESPVAAKRCAALLFLYHRERATGAPEHALLALKREMLRVAPTLAERVAKLSTPGVGR